MLISYGFIVTTSVLILHDDKKKLQRKLYKNFLLNESPCEERIKECKAKKSLKLGIQNKAIDLNFSKSK